MKTKAYVAIHNLKALFIIAGLEILILLKGHFTINKNPPPSVSPFPQIYQKFVKMFPRLRNLLKLYKKFPRLVTEARILLNF